ncbi:MAG: LysM domain-containing protein [Burkholderiales bacterium]|nr:LysM domain-containing protein [Burkholderiales bacterium]
MANYNFSPTSRYYNTATSSMVDENGREVTYLQRRFFPQPERFSTLQEHVVTQGERIDQITAKYLSDPTAFWRLLDANRAMQAQDVTHLGQRIKITLPEGIPGMPNSGALTGNF